MEYGKNHPAAKMIRRQQAELMLTNQELGGMIGVSHAAISRWRLGQDLPPRERAWQLEVVLGLLPGELSVPLGYTPAELPTAVERTEETLTLIYDLVGTGAPEPLATGGAKGS